MQFVEAMIYIIGTGMVGLLIGVILGVILAAEQILKLRDSNETLKRQLEEAKGMSKTEVYEINVTDPVPTQNYFEKF